MIKASAIKLNNKIYTGQSHYDVLEHNGFEVFLYGIPGFITDKGEFLTRFAASDHAYRCNQIIEQKLSLYSYDLNLK